MLWEVIHKRFPNKPTTHTTPAGKLGRLFFNDEEECDTPQTNLTTNQQSIGNYFPSLRHTPAQWDLLIRITWRRDDNIVRNTPEVSPNTSFPHRIKTQNTFFPIASVVPPISLSQGHSIRTPFKVMFSCVYRHKYRIHRTHNLYLGMH